MDLKLRRHRNLSQNSRVVSDFSSKENYGLSEIVNIENGE